MKVSLIRIKNILGVDDFEMRPSGFTLISGKNGTGKSSIIKAIKGALGSGKVSKLLSNGADTGEVVLELDDGTEITKKFTRDKSPSLRVKTEESGTIGKAQGFLDSIVDMFGVNPVSLITSEPKERGKLVLEAMPMSIEYDQIAEALGGVMTIVQGVERGHALHVIKKVKKIIYDERTGENRLAKEQGTLATQLLGSVSSDPVDVEGVNRQIDTLSEYTKMADSEIEALQAANRKRHSEKLVLKERLTSVEKEANSRRIIDGARKNEAEHKKRSMELTNAMDRVEAIKEGLLDNMPLPVSIGEDGEVYSDGVPFETLNTAKQIELALQLASIRSGKLGLICVDGMEALDPESFESFRSWAADHDELQFITTKVTGGPFEVEIDK